MTALVLYGTSACHLCELAEDLLLDVQALRPGLQFEKIDIANDDQLIERYGVRIPVLKRLSDGAELGWPFDDFTLREWLAG
ncbi:MAG: thioredoxin family protein [Spongiibacteraceae bacterium]|nr:thioredoxin family protein [Spongiibacteraceae bacterium]